MVRRRHVVGVCRGQGNAVEAVQQHFAPHVRHARLEHSGFVQDIFRYRVRLEVMRNLVSEARDEVHHDGARVEHDGAGVRRDEIILHRREHIVLSAVDVHDHTHVQHAIHRAFGHFEVFLRHRRRLEIVRYRIVEARCRPRENGPGEDNDLRAITGDIAGLRGGQPIIDGHIDEHVAAHVHQATRRGRGLQKGGRGHFVGHMHAGVVHACINGARVTIVAIEGATVACITQAIAVHVGLVVRDEGAVIAGVPEAVHVRIGLTGVGHHHTVVARVAHTIGIGIELAGVRHRGAIVEHVGCAIAIAVLGGERIGEEK